MVPAKVQTDTESFIKEKVHGHLLAQGRELARGIMINYNLYRHYFPLQALGRARQHLRRKV